MKSPFPKCRTCGKEHALGGCPEFKSTAAREDVHGGGDVIRSSERSVERLGITSKASPTTNMGIAGTQALPVETFSKALFDRNAYQKDYMRDLRKAKPLGMKVKEWRDKNET